MEKIDAWRRTLKDLEAKKASIVAEIELNERQMRAIEKECEEIDTTPDKLEGDIEAFETKKEKLERKIEALLDSVKLQEDD